MQQSAGPLHRSGIRATELADMMLRVKRHAELLDELLLRLQEIDIAFLVGRKPFVQKLRHPIIDRIAIRRRLQIKPTRFNFGGKIAAQNLFDVLAHPEGIEHLHVRETVQEEDAIDKAIGVLHFLDRFLAPFLGEILVTPVIEDAIMQPILIDGCEFAAQSAIEIFDNLCVSAHVRSSARLDRGGNLCGRASAEASRAALSPEWRLLAPPPHCPHPNTYPPRTPPPP